MFGNLKRKKIVIVYFFIILMIVIVIIFKSEDMIYCKFFYNRNKIVRVNFLMLNFKCLIIMLSIEFFDICIYFKWVIYVLNFYFKINVCNVFILY